MAASKPTIVPKTPESEAKLRALVKLTAPCIQTEEQAEEIAAALVAFTEQAIKDDRARIKAALWDNVEQGWIEQPVIDLIAKLGLDG